jgi:cytochrome c oxidase accessory protein FixG
MPPLPAAPEATRPRVIPIVPIAGAPGGAGTDGVAVSLYAASQTIHARSIDGIFARWRWAFVFLTQLVFYGLPWLEWGQRQAVLFDLGARRFYIFGLVLYPQDFIYLTGLLIISALSLFLFTAVAGRLWCGYACPQTVYTEMFMWIERKVEGERGARIRLDGEPLSMEKLVKKWFKHVLWIGLAMWTGFSFVGYFTPIRELGLEFLQTRMGSWEVFWVFFYGFATYGNAGFMREQVCKYMCPYARFQSAMFDKDTLIVGYDTQRCEPRGPRGRSDDYVAMGLGTCIDCDLCVQVCPTGIDIRDGLQYECIGCGACIDACDSVMDKMKYPRGLVRYATQNVLSGVPHEGGLISTAGRLLPGASDMLRHVLRPRVLVYTALLATLCVAMLASLVLRTPLKVDVVRDRGALSRIVAGGKLENVYRLQIMNATEQQQTYSLSVHGLPGAIVLPGEPVEVGPAQSRWVAARVQIPYESVAAGSHEIHFEIQAAGGGAHVTEKSAFLVPR